MQLSRWSRILLSRSPSGLCLKAPAVGPTALLTHRSQTATSRMAGIVSPGGVHAAGLQPKEIAQVLCHPILSCYTCYHIFECCVCTPCSVLLLTDMVVHTVSCTFACIQSPVRYEA